MLSFRKDQWLGNRWASVEIEPVDANCLLPILFHLSTLYQFDMPKLIDTLDGYATDFKISGSRAMLNLDNWSFSIAFENADVRDQVLAELVALPGDYFR